jgi:hypothetical protein
MTDTEDLYDRIRHVLDTEPNMLVGAGALTAALAFIVVNVSTDPDQAQKLADLAASEIMKIYREETRITLN